MHQIYINNISFQYYSNCSYLRVCRPYIYLKLVIMWLNYNVVAINWNKKGIFSTIRTNYSKTNTVVSQKRAPSIFTIADMSSMFLPSFISDHICTNNKSPSTEQWDAEGWGWHKQNFIQFVMEWTKLFVYLPPSSNIFWLSYNVTPKFNCKFFCCSALCFVK